MFLDDGKYGSSVLIQEPVWYQSPKTSDEKAFITFDVDWRTNEFSELSDVYYYGGVYLNMSTDHLYEHGDTITMLFSDHFDLGVGYITHCNTMCGCSQPCNCPNSHLDLSILGLQNNVTFYVEKLCGPSYTGTSSDCNTGKCVTNDLCQCDVVVGYEYDEFCEYSPLCNGQLTGGCGSHGVCISPDECNCTDSRWLGGVNETCVKCVDDQKFGPNCDIDCECSSHGRCVDAQNVCECDDDSIWIGGPNKFCVECVDNQKFGPNCDIDCVCGSHGICNKAFDNCNCTFPFFGEACDKRPTRPWEDFMIVLNDYWWGFAGGAAVIFVILVLLVLVIVVVIVIVVVSVSSKKKKKTKEIDIEMDLKAEKDETKKKDEKKVGKDEKKDEKDEKDEKKDETKTEKTDGDE